jgi:PPK2 family polyphosphate:nucleotide phosphotransferase
VVVVDYVKQFRVAPGKAVKLKDIDPGYKDSDVDRTDASAMLEVYRKKLRDLQGRLFAEKRHSVLICLQAMDTGGKDGTINHVLGAMNPQGCRVTPFRQPTLDELAHDFLWRIHRHTPARGEVAIFNRSHYEDVLVARVHKLVPSDVWSRRYDRINAFETEVADHETLILKFYLHISKKEQLKRFKARLDDPAKQWKISEADYKERLLWDDYMEAYEDALSRCSTEHAPWFVIPADHKWFRNLAVAGVVIHFLEGLDMKYPPPSVGLERIRRDYHDLFGEAPKR